MFWFKMNYFHRWYFSCNSNLIKFTLAWLIQLSFIHYPYFPIPKLRIVVFIFKNEKIFCSLSLFIKCTVYHVGEKYFGRRIPLFLEPGEKQRYLTLSHVEAGVSFWADADGHLMDVCVWFRSAFATKGSHMGRVCSTEICHLVVYWGCWELLRETPAPLGQVNSTASLPWRGIWLPASPFMLPAHCPAVADSTSWYAVLPY